MSQVYNVMIQGPGPWGFRLAGGKDFGVPLQISRVTPGSKAYLKGIKANDTLLAISGYDTSAMTHMEAQNLIKGVVGNLSLKLEPSNQATIWSPEISQQPDTGYSVSLKANKQQFQPARSSHNVKPRLFPGSGGGAAQPQSGPSAVRKQFNSPVGIYSTKNVADSYRGQTEGVASSGNINDDDQQAPPAWQKPSAYGSGTSQGPKSTSLKLLQQHIGEDERDLKWPLCPPCCPCPQFNQCLRALGAKAASGPVDQAIAPHHSALHPTSLRTPNPSPWRRCVWAMPCGPSRMPHPDALRPS